MLESATRSQLVVSMRKVLIRYGRMGLDGCCMQKTHNSSACDDLGLAMLSPMECVSQEELAKKGHM